MFVTGIHVIIVNAYEPVERIVHNGIYVTGYRVFPTQHPDGSLHRFHIKEQVIIHQIALNCITAPYPTVTLDAIDKKFPGGEMHSVCAYFPNSVQFFIITSERSAVILRQIFVLH